MTYVPSSLGGVVTGFAPGGGLPFVLAQPYRNFSVPGDVAPIVPTVQRLLGLRQKAERIYDLAVRAGVSGAALSGVASLRDIARSSLATFVDQEIIDIAAARGGPVSEMQDLVKYEISLSVPVLFVTPRVRVMVYDLWLGLRAVLYPDDPVPAASVVASAALDVVPDVPSVPDASLVASDLLSDSGVGLESVTSRLSSMSTTQLVLFAVVAGVSLNVLGDMFKSSPRKKRRKRRGRR